MDILKSIKKVMSYGVKDQYEPLADIQIKYAPNKYAVVDIEVGLTDRKMHDIGAIRYDGSIFHSASMTDFADFIFGVDYVCGHNIVHHDAKYLFRNSKSKALLVDTLYMSPLLFPERPYHRLVKDDKLITDQINNPVNDCEKTKDLLFDEIAHWNLLSANMRLIYATLLVERTEFKGFLSMVEANAADSVEDLCNAIKAEFAGKICTCANLSGIIGEYSCELAYALSLISTSDSHSITPGWVLRNFPNVEYVVRVLRHTPCNSEYCTYCNSFLDATHNLKSFFGYDQFRTYEGEPLQEDAVKAAVAGKSLLAIFPTGGGKSLTFQLPALMEGRTTHGLTVVISPLQSLMKDQVDNLEERGITVAVSINGLLDPIAKSMAIKQVMDGDASILYISPEMLRSKTVERILANRNVVRFVIDEAHCFSSWGQDFRVDYLYIGKFIREYQKRKGVKSPIPVSCFTATAKQKVVQDICDYFKQELDVDLQLFASHASRTNLRYSVIHSDSDEDKYQKLRALIFEHDCPTIVYVSRTKRTKELSSRLSRDGYRALPFNGKMEPEEKIANQNAFMQDDVRIIVATSAFGMGVDKKDVGLVVHYDISDSLENYVQEAGRAGRDPQLEGRCYVLYSDSDLDKHFILLNQTKLSISEIQQVWTAVKELTKQRERVCCSALEIARQAGWDDSVSDIETRVRTALAALEQSGYLERGNNSPHVFATGITVKNVDEAKARITDSALFEKDEIEKAVRIIKSLITQKYITRSSDSDAESRVDYLADILGLSKADVISSVCRMRQEGILADTRDISAYLREVSNGETASLRKLKNFLRLERRILELLADGPLTISYKQLNDEISKTEGASATSEKRIRTLLNFLTVRKYIRKSEDVAHNLELKLCSDVHSTMVKFDKRVEISKFAIAWLFGLVIADSTNENGAVQFSILDLYDELKRTSKSLFPINGDIHLEDVEETLYYLSKIDSVKMDGGFLVIYNAMDIKRKKELRLRYKIEDYRMLDEFYKQKVQQVHIVGEYANLMVSNYNEALQYVQDYFQMDYKRFIAKYFKGERSAEIIRNLTPGKYEQLFGQLSEVQKEIINDKHSRCIVVAAGPGSGKTRVLVHKLASLLLLEDVKHEQLLMLTFSRAAATEFKQRLIGLIGNAAHFVEIKTFHSYSFDLLGRIGNLEDAKDIISRAAEMINNGEVEPNRICKTVLVIDEAQDMSEEEYSLVKALADKNSDIRIIAVGDDDQNIYEFRGSNSDYMYRLLKETGGRFIEMTDNYRSSAKIVDAANSFIARLGGRMKTTPIVSKNNIDGTVEITIHDSSHLFQPVAENLANNTKDGVACILTKTNEEAAIMVALLRKYGINAKLIQSMDGFRFCNLAEMRYFLKSLKARGKNPLIHQELWDKAKFETCTAYKGSEALPYVERCLKQFEEISKTKYYSDFREFVYESSVEDFCDISNADVVVSTIHKAKGREFDDVYMMLYESCMPKNELERNAYLRRYYVGMTRAKKRLFIHTNGNVFRNIKDSTILTDQTPYALPEHVLLQLSHKDVNLGFFKSDERKALILSLRSGDALNLKGAFLHEKMENRAVAMLSKNMQQSIQEWRNKGYDVKSALVRFIVAWKPKDAPDNEKETAVLLADLLLVRTHNAVQKD